MDNERTLNLQAKAIAALMTKMQKKEITLTDEDMRDVADFVGCADDEVQISYSYNPKAGLLNMKISAPE